VSAFCNAAAMKNCESEWEKIMEHGEAKVMFMGARQIIRNRTSPRRSPPKHHHHDDESLPSLLVSCLEKLYNNWPTAIAYRFVGEPKDDVFFK